MYEAMLHERLKAAAGRRTYRELSALTQTHHESVRRYMTGQPPTLEYVSTLCAALGINGEWMLTGRGPMHTGDVKTHALKQANPAELLSAVAATLERLTERVERLELFLQTMETRLRGSTPGAGDPHGQATPLHLPDRLRGIADALPQRTPPHAG